MNDLNNDKINSICELLNNTKEKFHLRGYTESCQSIVDKLNDDYESIEQRMSFMDSSIEEVLESIKVQRYIISMLKYIHRMKENNNMKLKNSSIKL